MTNFAWNFYLYCLSGSKFREEFKSMFSCCVPDLSAAESAPVTGESNVSEVTTRCQKNSVKETNDDFWKMASYCDKSTEIRLRKIGHVSILFLLWLFVRVLKTFALFLLWLFVPLLKTFLSFTVSLNHVNDHKMDVVWFDIPDNIVVVLGVKKEWWTPETGWEGGVNTLKHRRRYDEKSRKKARRTGR